MLAVALLKESREATMCKGFGSTLIGPALQWYINLPTRSISSFAGLSEQFASSRSLEKTSDGLYEILQHRVEPLTLVRLPSGSWPQKTEDCITLKIEVNELLQKGHLREFLSEKDKAHLSKETAEKSKGVAPASPPRQDRVILSYPEVTPLIEFSGEVRQTAGEFILPGSEVTDTGNWGSFRRRRTLSQSKNPRDPQRTYVDRSAWSPPKPFKVASACKTWSSQDPRPPPHIDKITKNLNRYQPVVSRISKWGTSTSRRLPQRVHRTDLKQRAPRRHRMETLSQAGDFRTWSLQWMNVTTRFMEVLKTFISRKRWSPNTKGRGMKRVSTTVPRPKKEAELCRRRRNPPAKTLVPKASQILQIT
ncbi:hypothetical protein F2Q69_00013530 [Brassica cretica]|uniref:Retrotransposon gag domain-containing protein n=1 Tax=Brassica cretica TaxID=69181 RepID=A0A8S9QMH9_BRACR|nr:hypothetical protein F2Q69_00013530 [Brassica cretica]